METLWHQAWRLGLSWRKWARKMSKENDSVFVQSLLLPICSPWCQPPFPAQAQSCLTSPAASGIFSGAGNSCSLEKLLDEPFAACPCWISSFSPSFAFAAHKGCPFCWESKNISTNSTKTVGFFYQPNHSLGSWCDSTAGMIFHAHSQPGNAIPARQHQLHELPSFSTH